MKRHLARALFLPLFLAVVIPGCAPDTPPPPGIQTGMWRAWLDSPGGELPFELEFSGEGENLSATIFNGPERVILPKVELSGEDLLLEWPQFDNRINAKLSQGGRRLDGRWQRRTGPDSWSTLDFHADAGAAPRFASLSGENSASGEDGAGADEVSGRWGIDFESDDDPALGIFRQREGSAVEGTMHTAAGDYRYIAGTYENRRLRLSAFDGAHAFLFDATMQVDGTLAGDFWSRDIWHETWTARKAAGAEMPDGFTLTKWTGTHTLADLSFPDLDGNMRSLADPAFSGKARLIQIFGTWCPNCNDASYLMSDLEKAYAGRGLSIVGLAFEVMDDLERNAKQVRLYKEAHDIKFPILVAGLNDKDEASKAFPALDRIRAFPTFIFLDGDGEVEAIYQGFSGPATGKAHLKLRQSFEEIIERLLDRADSGAAG